MQGGETMNLLEIQNLSLFKEGRPILNNLSMDIWDGHVHAIIGPNGAGKSTLANTIMGLSGYRDFEGDILFEGESIKALSVDERARKGITLLFQEPARFEGLGVSQFILAGAKEKSRTVVEEALQKAGLSPEKYVKRAVDKTLSGGERKRIELASIYAMKPRLVLMDEPDSGVDIDSIKYIFAVIKEMRHMGSTVILITHSPEVLKHADHAFLICAGTLVDKGEMSRMFDYFNGKCVPCVHVGQPSPNTLLSGSSAPAVAVS
jgi:Fe-S cluster assembly ATP-binding protein